MKHDIIHAHPSPSPSPSHKQITYMYLSLVYPKQILLIKTGEVGLNFFRFMFPLLDRGDGQVKHS